MLQAELSRVQEEAKAKAKIASKKAELFPRANKKRPDIYGEFKKTIL